MSNSGIAQSQQLVKGVTQLYGRLFDHHAVVQAEITHMKDFDRLTQSSVKSSQTIIDGLKTTGESLEICETELPRLQDVLKSLVAAKQIADSVLHDSETPSKNEYLSSQRSDRQRRWQIYMTEMCDQSAQIDQIYKLESEASEKYYQDAETKLNLNSPN